MNLSHASKIIRSGLIVILLTGFLLTSINPSGVRAAGIIRYASPTGLTTGTCDVWVRACTLRFALSLAVSGDQIWIKQGTHKPHASDRTQSFTLKNRVAIYGGFVGTETSLAQRNPYANVTILSGEIGAATNNDNSYHVVVASGTNNTAILNGVTITEGHANGTTNVTSKGGGMYNNAGSPTLANLVFINNSAKTQGGGMYNYGGAAPKLSVVTFSDNTASTNTVGGAGRGGGMYNNGSAPTLTNVTFSGNIADSGGGIFNTNLSNPTLSAVTFQANEGFDGGGMYNQTSDPTLKNATFQGNVAQRGGGMFNVGGSAPSITNVTIADNSADTNGGGMFNTNSSPTLVNVILWSNLSTSGTDEVFNNSSTPVITNSVVAGGCPAGASCATIIAANPGLSPLTDNGGFTKTMAIDDHGSAINTGLDASCPDADQRDVPRPIGPHCDIGAYESTDLPATVVSITRATGYTDPTSQIKVGFVVTFSQPMINVDKADFTLTTTGSITDATIVSVNGSGSVYGVIVNTGTGNGTLRLDIPVTATILDMSGDPPTNLPYVSGETYTIQKMLNFRSNGADDGWILESGQNTNAGGSLDIPATTLRIGDDSGARQYRSVLSFDTSNIPDDALITKIILKIKQQSINGNGNPGGLFGGLIADVCKGPFSAPALQLNDWQSSSGQSFGPFYISLSNGWYAINLTKARAYINPTANDFGLTQIRLRFQVDDNNDAVADFLSFFSGNAALSSRPQLIVEFHVP